jgi:hypothetical protein
MRTAKLGGIRFCYPTFLPGFFSLAFVVVVRILVALHAPISLLHIDNLVAFIFLPLLARAVKLLGTTARQARHRHENQNNECDAQGKTPSFKLALSLPDKPHRMLNKYQTQ